MFFYPCYCVCRGCCMYSSGSKAKKLVAGGLAFAGAYALLRRGKEKSLPVVTVNMSAPVDVSAPVEDNVVQNVVGVGVADDVVGTPPASADLEKLGIDGSFSARDSNAYVLDWVIRNRRIDIGRYISPFTKLKFPAGFFNSSGKILRYFLLMADEYTRDGIIAWSDIELLPSFFIVYGDSGKAFYSALRSGALAGSDSMFGVANAGIKGSFAYDDVMGEFKGNYLRCADGSYCSRWDMLPLVDSVGNVYDGASGVKYVPQFALFGHVPFGWRLVFFPLDKHWLASDNMSDDIWVVKVVGGVLSFVSSFIPYAGPFISAGVAGVTAGVVAGMSVDMQGFVQNVYTAFSHMGFSGGYFGLVPCSFAVYEKLLASQNMYDWEWVLKVYYGGAPRPYGDGYGKNGGDLWAIRNYDSTDGQFVGKNPKDTDTPFTQYSSGERYYICDRFLKSWLESDYGQYAVMSDAVDKVGYPAEDIGNIVLFNYKNWKLGARG